MENELELTVSSKLIKELLEDIYPDEEFRGIIYKRLGMEWILNSLHMIYTDIELRVLFKKMIEHVVDKGLIELAKDKD